MIIIIIISVRSPGQRVLVYECVTLRFPFAATAAAGCGRFLLPLFFTPLITNAAMTNCAAAVRPKSAAARPNVRSFAR